jgi:hypothetical protein
MHYIKLSQKNSVVTAANVRKLSTQFMGMKKILSRTFLTIKMLRVPHGR